ncbi:MAG: 50S ribosomal protein L2 [Candidatus Vidania fulgoroideorum]
MIRKYKPTSPGIRHKLSIKNEILNKHIIKKLLKKIIFKSGRNNKGKITTRHKGKRVKRKYRIIDFKRKKKYIYSKITGINYDPNRNSYISTICYQDGEYNYIPYIKGNKIGDKIISGKNIEFKIGNSTNIKNIPIGIKISCIENTPNNGAVYCRSAGTYAKIISKSKKECIVKLQSGKLKKINNKCNAVIGQIGNYNFNLKKIGKAGTNRLKGIRPTVRGVAMNPIDHPHGGGEGKTSTKRNPTTPWGKKTKGLKTRKNKRTNKTILK